MENLQFRKMLATDLQQVCEIEQQSQTGAWNLLQFQDCLQANYHCWLCYQNKNSIVSYGIVSTVLDEATLHNLCVAKQCQGQGYGKAMLHYIIAWASSVGQKQVFLEVRASNQRAIFLYESWGFIFLGVRKNYYPTDNGREDALNYSLTLSASSNQLN